MNTLKRKQKRDLQGECVAQSGLSEDELEMDRGRWERRVLTLLSMKSINSLIHRDLELYQANQGTHHAHRDNIKVFEELNTKNGIYQENQAKD